MHAKKPLIIQNGVATAYNCPNCSSFILSTKDARVTGRKVNYCPDCGQHIDWEGVKIQVPWPM